MSSTHRTTSPSRYFERQGTPVVPAQRHTREDDYGVIVGFIATAALGFCLGMVLAAAWAGVL